MVTGIGFVVTGNNHHIAIYEDKDNKLVQHSLHFGMLWREKKIQYSCCYQKFKDVWSQLLGKELPESF